MNWRLRYEREEQRGKGKQEGTAEKPQREEKAEEGEEEQVSQAAPTGQRIPGIGHSA